jgi:Ca2+-binding EF-hand superfamily protein
MDVNADQQVTRDEFIGFWVKAFHRQDQDGDDRLTAAELGSETAFEGMDSDGSGKASLAEFKAMYGQQFKGRDKNTNGVLTADEL